MATLSVKVGITSIAPAFLIFPDLISFQHVLHFGVARSQIEWKLKAKTVLSILTELPCYSTSSFPVELTKLKNQTSNKHGNWHV